MRILLIEDDSVLSDVLVMTLTQQRYAVDTADDGILGLEYADSGIYDLLLIDVGLPRLDGISLCQRLRSAGKTTPILLMTAKDAADERIRGLDAGADDYLTKPLDLAELQARLRALLRRGEVSPTSVLAIGPLRLDPVSCEVTYADAPLKLTPKEYSLLELFLRNPGRVFSRSLIVEHLWTFDDPPLEDSVKAHVKGLRRKLRQAGAKDWIENVYGLGYKLTPQEPPSEAAEPAPSVEQQFDQAMAVLWSQHQGAMAERLSTLKSAAIALQQDSLRPSLRISAGQAAHKLAGVLGMFGRDDGTRVARDLEALLADLETCEAARFDSLVQQLEAALDLTESVALSEAPRLLLVGPNAALAQDLQVLTQALGLGWSWQRTVADASTWLQTHSPDLVVLDLVAPFGLQEQQLLARLSAHIPALVLTETHTLTERVQIAATAAQVLAKPATADQIWQTAAPLLERHQAKDVQILAVDDDPVLLQALQTLLTPWGMQVTPLDEPSRCWEVLAQSSPDLLILDIEMPNFNGVELCRAVRSDRRWQSLPILFLTARQDAATVQQVFAAGADDYVTKPAQGPELITRINNRLARSRLLQTLARLDAKTGLANQIQFQQDLQQLIQQGQTFTLALLQLTELTQLNRRYGHSVGHQVLRRWGDLLKSQPVTAQASYWDNGEFAIALPQVSRAEAPDFLAPLLAAIRKQIFTAPTGDRFQTDYRLGLAEFPLDGSSPHSLYQASLIA